MGTNTGQFQGLGRGWRRYAKQATCNRCYGSGGGFGELKCNHCCGTGEVWEIANHYIISGYPKGSNHGVRMLLLPHDILAYDVCDLGPRLTGTFLDHGYIGCLYENLSPYARVLCAEQKSELFIFAELCDILTANHMEGSS